MNSMILNCVTFSILQIAFAVEIPQGVDNRDELSISDSESVIAIYTEDHGWAATGNAELILPIWPDGRCVFSTDRYGGGAPFRQTTIAKERVQQLFKQLQRSGFMEDVNLNTPRVPPDLKFTAILVRANGKQLKMKSTYENVLQQSNKLLQHQAMGDLPGVGMPANGKPKVMPTPQKQPHSQPQPQQKGQALTEPVPAPPKAPNLFRNRLETISALSRKDLIHRAVWNEIRTSLDFIHETKSTLTHGTLNHKNRILSWTPATAEK